MSVRVKLLDGYSSIDEQYANMIPEGKLVRLNQDGNLSMKFTKKEFADFKHWFMTSESIENRRTRSKVAAIFVSIYEPLINRKPTMIELFTYSRIGKGYLDQVGAIEMHRANIESIGYSFDFSKMGSGKTFIAMAIASLMDATVLIVCPDSVIAKWNSLSLLFNIPILYSPIPYTSLVTKGTRVPNFPKDTLFLREGKKVIDISNEVRNDVANILDSGNLLVIYDEIHDVRNKSANKSRGAAILSGALVNMGAKFMGLSGTPNMTTDMTWLTRGLSIGLAYPHEDWYDYKMIYVGIPEYRPTGVLNLVDMVRNNNELRELARKETVKYKLNYNAFDDIVDNDPEEVYYRKKILVSFVNSVLSAIFTGYHVIIEWASPDVVVYVRDLPVPSDPEDRKIVVENLTILKIILDQRQDLGKMQKGDIGTIMGALNTLSYYRAKAVMDDMIDAYDNGEHIVWSAFSKDANNYVANEFEHITGKEPLKIYDKYGKNPKRRAVIKEFQERGPRMLVANPEPISTGIDLDDKYGDQPRTVYASIHFGPERFFQFVTRFLRRDSKSDPLIYLPLFKFEDISEDTIINKMISQFWSHELLVGSNVKFEGLDVIHDMFAN
jgi:hypothetical protein